MGDIIRFKNIQGLTEEQSETAQRIDELYQDRIVRQGNRIASFVNYLSEQGMLESFNAWEEAQRAHREDGPHAKACGVKPHRHGLMCHKKCPTCKGEDLF